MIWSVYKFRWRCHLWFARKQWKNSYIWCIHEHCWQVHSKQDNSWWPTTWFQSRWWDCSNNGNYNKLHSFVRAMCKTWSFKYPPVEILLKEWFMLQFWLSSKNTFRYDTSYGSFQGQKDGLDKASRKEKYWFLLC